MSVRRFLTISALFAWAIAQTACGKKDLQPYYFPLKSLMSQPTVYEYKVSTADTALTIYWYYQTLVQNDSIFFVGNCYDQNFQVIQLMREQQVANGMKLQELFFYGSDTEGGAVKVPATIEGGAVYPFSVTDSNSVFVNVIRYPNPQRQGNTTTLTRNRRYLQPTEYDFKGKKYDAVAFQMKEEQSESDAQSGGFVHVFTVKEIYAKGLGLVYTQRSLDNGVRFETRLVDTFSMATLENRFQKHLNQ
jgi:hypothetical protein